jgi:hypothetical protein
MSANDQVERRHARKITERRRQIRKFNALWIEADRLVQVGASASQLPIRELVLGVPPVVGANGSLAIDVAERVLLTLLTALPIHEQHRDECGQSHNCQNLWSLDECQPIGGGCLKRACLVASVFVGLFAVGAAIAGLLI